MSNYITFNFNQPSCYNRYKGSRDECQISENGVQDWLCAEDNSGFTNKYYCSKIDIPFFTIGFSSANKNPLVSAQWVEDRKSLVKLIYNLDYIDTIDQLNNIIVKFGPNSDIYNQSMFNLCSKSVKELDISNSTCLKDKNNNLPSDCSIMNSNSSVGNYIRKWFNNQSQQNKDAIIANYCLGKNNAECSCVNRSNDPIYQKIKTSNNINDSCWYVPCSSGNLNYLLQSDVINKPCPNNICSQIYQFINDNNVSLNDVKNQIACKFDESDHHEDIIPPFEIPKNNNMIIYGILATIIILLIILIIIFLKK